MRSLPRISAKLFGEPWLVSPVWHRNAVAIYNEAVKSPSALLPSERVDKRDAPKIELKGNGVAVMDISGPIGKHLSSVEMDCGGGFCLTRFNQALDTLVSQGVKTVVFDMDTPGGTVTGVAETGAKIAALKDKGIMTIAYTESMACSAGYWLASACDAIFAAPSAIVGSVGVYCAILDTTGYYEQMGMKWEYFVGQNASMKAAGAEGRSLTDEQRQRIQANVDSLATDFYAHVSSHRKGINMDAVKTGDAWRASDAPKGLVDGLIPTLEDLLATLVTQN